MNVAIVGAGLIGKKRAASLKKNDRSGLIRSSNTGRYRDAPKSAQALNQKKFFHLIYDNCSKDLYLKRKYLKLKHTIS